MTRTWKALGQRPCDPQALMHLIEKCAISAWVLSIIQVWRTSSTCMIGHQYFHVSQLLWYVWAALITFFLAVGSHRCPSTGPSPYIIKEVSMGMILLQIQIQILLLYTLVMYWTLASSRSLGAPGAAEPDVLLACACLYQTALDWVIEATVCSF